MDRTTIMLPPDLKIRAANQSKKEGISLGQYIRETLEKSLDSEDGKAIDNDPLFLDNAVFEGQTPKDLSSEHDAHLYDDE